SPSLVILSGAKNLRSSLRVNSARNLVLRDGAPDSNAGWAQVERTRARFLAPLGMTICFCLLVLSAFCFLPSAFCFLPTLFRLLTPDFRLLNPDSRLLNPDSRLLNPVCLRRPRR